MLKGADTSPVVTAKVSTHGITLTRQSLDERSSAYLSYDRVISAIEEHRSLKNWSYIMKLLSHTRTAPGSHARTAPGSHARDAPRSCVQDAPGLH